MLKNNFLIWQIKLDKGGGGNEKEKKKTNGTDDLNFQIKLSNAKNY